MYVILLVFLAIGAVYPAIGFAAVICMVAPVALSVRRGRYWCGHYCPRGSFYDHIVARFSQGRAQPEILRAKGFRAFMVLFIFMVFGVQTYFAWGDLAAMGGVFVRIIFWTTVAGIVLGVLYRPRTWCGFCPMGSMSNWVAPRGEVKLPYQKLMVDASCVGCRLCAKVCPMGLYPGKAKGDPQGFTDGDCLKCGQCTERCPKHALRLE